MDIETAVDKLTDVIGPMAVALLAEDGRSVEVMRKVSVSVMSIVVVGSPEVVFEARGPAAVMERELA